MNGGTNMADFLLDLQMRAMELPPDEAKKALIAFTRTLRVWHDIETPLPTTRDSANVLGYLLDLEMKRNADSA